MNRQAGKAVGRGLQEAMMGQVHWVKQVRVEAWLHPGYLLSPRMSMGTGQTPAGGMGRIQSRPPWPRLAPRIDINANTRSGPNQKRCRGHIHSHLEQGTARPLPIFSTTGREASLQRSWLRQHVVHGQVIVAHKLAIGSWRGMPGMAGAGANLGDVPLG